MRRASNVASTTHVSPAEPVTMTTDMSARVLQVFGGNLSASSQGRSFNGGNALTR
jgi:hypothetical protein